MHKSTPRLSAPPHHDPRAERRTTFADLTQSTCAHLHRSAGALATALALFLLALLTGMPTWAEGKSDAAGTIKQALESRYPGTRVLEVKPSAMPGLYEVYLGNELVYADASGDYLVGGPLVDTQTHQNLTEARLNDYGKVDFKTLPLDRAIKVVKGNGNREFAVFSDPECPFCQELEKTLLTVTDITMYVFLFPIATLHPQATSKAHAIWCAKDRAQAWSQWMHEKKLPDVKSNIICPGDPVAELQKLGEKLHVNSTPTLFFASGKRVAGALPLDELQRLLSAPRKS